ncbi:microprocessor complex subunit DGCR8-like isoform X2 [Pecten maximus]|uniref:microprocessor complex subunit DGCR8-like isoform X2 n=1 Tax=Pecten maximus TaxID=6579 RepID=UPI001457F1F2|nr:microprocessor complex subunit DGCR8-like isoform X2 [Pecten maximus]
MEDELDSTVPPSSTQTSNQKTDRLDIGSDNGGKMTSEMDDGDLEEGEIESEVESIKDATRVLEPEKWPETENTSEASNAPVESDGEIVSEAEINEAEDKASVLEEREIDRQEDKPQPQKAAKRPHAVLEEDKEEDESDDEVPAKLLRADSAENIPKEPADGTQEFEIIDDLGDAEGDNDMGDFYSEDDLEDSEIYAWLDEGFERRTTTDCPIQKEKIVLTERGNNPFEVLPEGWVVITHNSGMPVYLHKTTRVCTLARPYFLGPGSVRKHDIPVSAVPCLQYRRELHKENSNTQQFQDQQQGTTVRNDESSDRQAESVKPGSQSQESMPPLPPTEPVANGGNSHMQSEYMGERPPLPSEPVPNGENADMSNEAVESQPPLPPEPIANGENSDMHTELVKAPPQPPDPVSNGETNGTASTGEQETPLVTTADGSVIAPPIKIEYAEDRKKQNTVDPTELREYCEKLFEFRTITVKKFKTWKDRRRHLNAIRSQSRPALPSTTKLITCKIPQVKGDEKPKLKEFVLNPLGKSYVCILHEYAQHTLRIQPRYVFKELENAQNPYSATVVIGDIEYGTGYSSSKKSAKMAAAKETLTILIPEMSKVTEEINKDEDLSFFDEIKIEDPRVYELCNKVGQPSPYQILQECLSRNYGMGDTNCKIDVKPLKHQKSEYSLTVGKRTVTVVCKNKREGKQRAAQAILQELHPHITNLGSLLRLYGRSSWKNLKEKKREEHSITELQSQTCSKKPNTAVLDKLKEEMEKLYKQKVKLYKQEVKLYRQKVKLYKQKVKLYKQKVKLYKQKVKL